MSGFPEIRRLHKRLYTRRNRSALQNLLQQIGEAPAGFV